MSLTQMLKNNKDFGQALVELRRLNQKLQLIQWAKSLKDPADTPKPKTTKEGEIR